MRRLTSTALTAAFGVYLAFLASTEAAARSGTVGACDAHYNKNTKTCDVVDHCNPETARATIEKYGDECYCQCKPK